MGCLVGVGQGFPEVLQGPLGGRGRWEVSRSATEVAHGLQGSGVEGFEDVEGGEEEGAGAAGGVEDGDFGQGVPEGAHQFRPLAVDDDVPGEPLAVQVEGDEVVDALHFAGGQLCRGLRA